MLLVLKVWCVNIYHHWLTIFIIISNGSNRKIENETPDWKVNARGFNKIVNTFKSGQDKLTQMF